MLTVISLLVLIPHLLGQNPSPCPKIFSYEPRGQEEDRWYGVISLQTREDLDGVWLKIILDRPAELLGNWFGEATSSDNQEYTIKNPRYKLEAGPPVSIRFFVKYNLAARIPSLQTIRLNGKTVCTARREEVVSTTPQLHISQIKPNEPIGGSPAKIERPTSHKPNIANQSQKVTSSQSQRPRPSSQELSNGSQERPTLGNDNFVSGSSQERPNTNNYDERNPSSSLSGASSNGLSSEDVSSHNGNDFFPGDFALNSPNPVRPPPRPSGINKRKVQCGTVATRASPLISHGQNTTQGQWPWHGALYHVQGAQLMYTCGVTLISESHVLTAAHCVARPHSNRPVQIKNLVVYLGKHNLKKFGPETQDREISDIVIHPQYNYSVYFNDIAVLKLQSPIDVTNYVRPCCLWEDDADIERVLNKLGTVVGWGFDENRQISDTLMQAQMPVVSAVNCIYSNREFFSQFTFEKTYCAGFRNGTSVCNGDSGGGMVFPKHGSNGQNTVWQIRGIVSVGVALQGQGVCDPRHYIVFTDVAKHLDWIKQAINE